jgi:hypothetical protein
MNETGSFNYELKKLHSLIPLPVFKALEVSGHLYKDLDAFVAQAILNALIDEGYLTGSKKPKKEKGLHGGGS